MLSSYYCTNTDSNSAMSRTSQTIRALTNLFSHVDLRVSLDTESVNLNHFLMCD